MVDVATIALFLGAGLASMFMAWTIGAGSAGSTPFAPAVGARSISVMRASLVVGICILAGAILQGANVSEAVGRDLIANGTLSPTGATVALLLAASLVTIGVFTGYPIPTAFTVTGAVIGVGLALGGDPNWAKYAEIAGLWMLTPFIGGGSAYVLARWLQSETGSERFEIATLGGIVGAVFANIEFVLLGPAGEGLTIAAQVGASFPGPSHLWWLGTTLGVGLFGGAIVYRSARLGVVHAERKFTIIMGVIVAFSAGGSQVGLAVGPLLPLFSDIVPLIAILTGGGIGLLVGAWTGAPRMIKAVAQDYASLGPRRALAALLPSFVIAQIAILFGIPISFNETILSAVVGSGMAAGSGIGISRAKVGYTLFAWISSFVLAFGLGFGGIWILETLG